MIKFFTFLCTIAAANAIPFTDCGSDYTLTHIEVENCKYLPCPLFMDSSTKIVVKLYADFHTTHMTQEITITTKGIKKHTTSSPGPCTGTRPCPVNHGSDASFTTDLYVPNIAPFESVLQWVIKSDTGKQLMCFTLDVILCEQFSDDDSCYQ